jgi:type IV pilus assembly protein PilV
MKTLHIQPQAKVALPSQRGFSLIEVLVSIVVMAFGLLGVSGMMLSGVNNATGMDLSSRAAQSAGEIMDAMRANRNNIASYVVSYSKDTASLTSSIADTDLKQWLTAVRRLPGGDAKIELATGSTSEYVVTVRFSNCLGTLSGAELANCKDSTNTDSRKREISFRLGI